MSNDTVALDGSYAYADRVIFDNGRIRLSLVNGRPICSWIDNSGSVPNVQSIPLEVIELVSGLKLSLSNDTKEYRDLGFRAVSPSHCIGLSCHHCKVTWTGCAAECCCPECGAPKGYHNDDWDECYCEECKPEFWSEFSIVDL